MHHKAQKASRHLHPIQQLLGRYQILRDLQKDIHQQQGLLLSVRKLLPEPLAQHCVNASINNAQLVLSVDTPVWASKLRFLAPQLLSNLRKKHPGIANIKVRSTPSSHYKTPDTVTKKQVHKRNYPNHISTALEEQASYIPSAELSDALKRLARTLKN